MYNSKPGTTKTIMTVLAAIALAAAVQFPQYAAALGVLAGALGGGAHVPSPGAKRGQS